MKDGYRKPWKKFYFMLRASGLYQSTKGKSMSADHLVKVVTFHDHDLYSGINFKKVLQAPSQFCFCLKPTSNSSSGKNKGKDVKVFCAETAQSLTTWMAGIRMAKYGISLYDDYKRAFLTQFRVEETEAPEKKSSVDSIALSATERMAGSRPPHHNQFATIPESHPPGPTPVPTSSSTQVQASVPTSVPTPIPTPVKPPSSQQHQAVVETQPPTPPPQAQKPPPIAAVPQPTPIQPQARQPPPAPAAVPQRYPNLHLFNHKLASLHQHQQRYRCTPTFTDSTASSPASAHSNTLFEIKSSSSFAT
jgi:amyloid beta A4 precursor protein-binding family B protein 1-interacting protein